MDPLQAFSNSQTAIDSMRNAMGSIALSQATVTTLILLLVFFLEAAAVFGYSLFKRKVLFELFIFNHTVFTKDREFFERYRGQPHLRAQDLLEMRHDSHFLSHTLAKEPLYFNAICRIAESVRVLRLCKIFTGSALAIGGVVVFFVLTDLRHVVMLWRG